LGIVYNFKLFFKNDNTLPRILIFWKIQS